MTYRSYKIYRTYRMTFYSSKIPGKMYPHFHKKILSSTTVLNLDNTKKCFVTPVIQLFHRSNTKDSYFKPEIDLQTIEQHCTVHR